MSRSVIAKAAALVCGVASLAVMSMAASADAAYELNKDDYPEAKEGQINFVARKANIGEIYVGEAADGYVVHYSCDIACNPGFASGDVGLVYDPKLEPVQNEGQLVYTKGEAGNGISDVQLDTEKHKIVFKMSEEKNSGKFITVDFKLPKIARQGDRFHMGWDVEDLRDESSGELPWMTVDGYINITVGSEYQEAPVLNPVVTTAPAETTAATDATTGTGSDTTATTSGSTSATTTKAVTTTKAANGGSNSDSAKTGDAGSGVAVAALLLAAGTAAAARRKKD